MTRVRATCPTCGDVEVTTAEVQVLVCPSTASSSYAFVCPRCRLTVTKQTEAHIVDLLISAGVRTVTWTPPAELAEVHHGPPICHDDLLAFHFEVQGDTWLEQLTSR